MRVGLVFGGASVEHEVSVVSARGVREGLSEAGMEVVPLGVSEEGSWLPPGPSAAVLDAGAARVRSAGPDERRVLVDPGRGLVVSGPAGPPEPLGVDVVFPLIHGWGGEDGRVQGLLEWAGIAYVGAGVLGSAVGMDKHTSKSLLEFHGLPVAPWLSFGETEYRADPSGVVRRVGSFGLPVFVKPANGGSSVGITRVADGDAIADGVEAALRCDGKVVVETALDAREIECAVIGSDPAEASVPGEIIPSREFYDYEAKYEDGTSELRIPASLPSATAERIRAGSLEAFRALDLAGLARVDWFLARSSEELYVNEINTLPGFTPISMFPKLWEASGVSYPDLLRRLVRLALDRQSGGRSKARRREP